MTPCVTEEVHPPPTHPDVDPPAAPVLLLVPPCQLANKVVLPRSLCSGTVAWPGRHFPDLLFGSIKLVTVCALLFLGHFLGGPPAGRGADLCFREGILAIAVKAGLALGWASALLMFGATAIT